LLQRVFRKTRPDPGDTGFAIGIHANEEPLATLSGFRNRCVRRAIRGVCAAEGRLYGASKRRGRVLARQRKRHYTFARRIGITSLGPDMARHHQQPQLVDMPGQFA
jgi:hypothetical protein